MSSVYRAEDVVTERIVAAKVLWQPSKDALLRFAREVRALQQLEHPAIVRALASGTTEEGHAYLIMEWLDGFTLAERLARRLLTPSQALALAIRLADAMASVHEAGIVHRDVKPGNILLRGGKLDDPVLIDFGVARPTNPDREHEITGVGMIVGTAGYMAPEQVMGERTAPAVDVYALGAVMWRCMSGCGPFDASDSTSLLVKVATEDPPRLSTVVANAPAQLDDLLAELLARRPAMRPRHGRALVERLRRAAPIVTHRSVLRLGYEERAQALCAKAVKHAWRGQNAHAEEAASAALCLAPRGSSVWCRALGAFATASARVGRYERLPELACALASERSLALAHSNVASTVESELATLMMLGGIRADGRYVAPPREERAEDSAGAREDLIARAWRQRALASQALVESDPCAFLDSTIRAQHCFARARAPWPLMMDVVNVLATRVYLGQWSEAIPSLLEARTRAESLGLLGIAAGARCVLGVALMSGGREEEAIAEQRTAADAFAEQRNVRMEGMARTYLATSLLRTDEAWGALIQARQSVVLLRTVPARRAHALVVLAVALAALGRPAEALVAASAGYELAEQLDGVEGSEGIIRAVYAEALGAISFEARARVMLETSRARMLASVSRVSDDALRMSFTGTVLQAASAVCLPTWPVMS